MLPNSNVQLEMTELEEVQLENQALQEIIHSLKLELDGAKLEIQRKNNKIAYLSGVIRGLGGTKI